jgi:thioredoxin 1
MSEVISADDFRAKVLDSPMPVIVDFFATWCGPCKMIAPVLDDIAAEADGKFIIVKVDIDRDPQLANQYNVQSVPTLAFIKGGKLVDQILGAVPKSAIMAKIDALM